MNFVEFIKHNANTVGWSAMKVLSDSGVALPFNSNEGPIQVFIQPCGKFEGQTVIEFSSPGLPVPADEGLEKVLSRMLLERNSKALQGHWGIEDSSDGPMYSVFVSQIANTMDPPEFKQAVLGVVNEYEKTVSVLRKAAQQSNVSF